MIKPALCALIALTALSGCTTQSRYAAAGAGLGAVGGAAIGGVASGGNPAAALAAGTAGAAVGAIAGGALAPKPPVYVRRAPLNDWAKGGQDGYDEPIHRAAGGRDSDVCTFRQAQGRTYIAPCGQD